MNANNLGLQPEPPLHLTRGRHGLFLVNKNDQYIGRALLDYGEYSELELQTLLQLCVPGRDVIEVGANIGSLSIPLAKKQRMLGRKLMVIEPVPTTFNHLCANLALNTLHNILAKNVACSDAAGEIYAPIIDLNSLGNFGAVELSERRQSESDISVACSTLDLLVPEGLEVGLIKIDVEGYEQAVLRGATETLLRWRPTIYLENDRREKSAALIDWLWQADYELWWDFVPLYNPNNYLGNSENIFLLPNKQGVMSPIFSQNMIALPVERSAQVERRKVQSLDDWCFE